MARKDRDGLSLKQKLFCLCYLVCLNATQAAAEAGYSKLSPAQGSKLLTNPAIAAYIAKATSRQFARLELTDEKLLREAMRVAFSDIGRLFSNDGSLLPIHELDADARAMISSVEVKRTLTEGRAQEVTKIRLWAKAPALDLLFKHRGLLQPERVDHRHLHLHSPLTSEQVAMMPQNILEELHSLAQRADQLLEEEDAHQAARRGQRGGNRRVLEATTAG